MVRNATHVRSHPIFALVLVLVVAAGAVAQEMPAEVGLSIQTPGPLVPGARESVQVTVRVRPDASMPILLTAATDGDAVEAVRGRLLRPDALDPEAEELRFQVPIAARGEGTSVLRIEVLSYACNPSCRALRVSASAVLQVRSP